ncbi:hypothetical protein RI065_04050 [Mycoplasmatota bacterium zrk1]
MKKLKIFTYSSITIIIVTSIVMLILNLFTVRFDFDEITDIEIKVPIYNKSTNTSGWKSYQVTADEASELIIYLDELKFRNYYTECEMAWISYEVEMNIDGEVIRFGLGCTYFHAHVGSKSPNPFQAKYDRREYEIIIEDIIGNYKDTN